MESESGFPEDRDNPRPSESRMLKVQRQVAIQVALHYRLYLEISFCKNHPCPTTSNTNAAHKTLKIMNTAIARFVTSYPGKFKV